MAKSVRLAAAPTKAHFDFLTKVREAARQGGAGRREMVALLKSGRVNWADAKAVAELAREFQIAWVSGILSLDFEGAAIVFSKKQFSAIVKEPDDTYKTQVEQRAYRSAITAFSECAAAAGMPARREGSPQKASEPRPAQSATKAQEPVQDGPAAAAFMAPKAKAPADAIKVALDFARMLDVYMRNNGKFISGDLRDVFELFEAEVKRIAQASADDVSSAPKPVKPVKPVKATPVQIAAH